MLIPTETRGIGSDHYMSVLVKKKINENLYTLIAYGSVPVLLIDEATIALQKKSNSFVY